jgi:hypothetical protein
MLISDTIRGVRKYLVYPTDTETQTWGSSVTCPKPQTWTVAEANLNSDPSYPKASPRALAGSWERK